jgi:(1->4)-alpha-D-glucan 1-alpha-D-glucosylmutase
MTPATIPVATYRLQFNSSFTFEDAAAIVEYLHALGISHCYASNYLASVPGSTHGYDLVNPTRLNPELGDEQTYRAWVHALRAHDMGHIVDLVPNHMGIARSANPWWQDVLENGPRSRYASLFDIDWHPLKKELENKVLLPILGDSYGAVLERQEITLEYQDGAFHVRYGDYRLPIAPDTYDQVRRVDANVQRAVEVFNGRKGDPRSFDLLDNLLSAQSYRLAYWRVAGEEINYRRFFDINELAAIRMEDPAVFDRVHAYLFKLIAEGMIDGLRIDHVDGLYDPGGYLQRLQARARDVRSDLYSPDRPLYVVVEKILGADEELPAWPVEGTTGYDFAAAVDGLFVDGRNESAITAIYERFTRLRARFSEIAYQGKQVVLRVSMASELNVLAQGLNRFSERNRHYRDFTLNSLAYAMREIIACFPVYRSYVNDREPVSASDREFIEHAVMEAKRRNPGRPRLVFEFIRGLLLKKADYIPEAEHTDHMQFVAKFQQVTSPVTAKGIEDTALYIYNRLTSLNEVGSQPDRFGVAPDALHAWLAGRAARWPHGLSASSTHDTKRSEDVRARINILSELPGAWKQATSRWARLNRRGRSIVEGESYPSRNEEYLLYQTLLGTWPLAPMTQDEEREYCARIVGYMHKAMREAKVYTSWINPSEPHERAMTRFVEMALAPDHAAFRNDFLQFHSRVAQYGIYTSLAQLTIKIAAPGVPDFYQGTELWNFTLVDPDNRRAVDYRSRQELLRELDAALAERGRAAVAVSLMSNPRDDRVKLYTSTTELRFRRDHAELFQFGDYCPLATDGTRRDHLFAFARRHATGQVVTAVPRLVAALLPEADDAPLGERIWADTSVELPQGSPTTFRNVLTGTCVRARQEGSRSLLSAAEIFSHFPVALLAATERPH